MPAPGFSGGSRRIAPRNPERTGLCGVTLGIDLECLHAQRAAKRDHHISLLDMRHAPAVLDILTANDATLIPVLQVYWLADVHDIYVVSLSRFFIVDDESLGACREISHRSKCALLNSAGRTGSQSA